MDVTNTLNMGESMFVNGGVLAGATVTASQPVQVHELTGRIGSDFQSRTFAIRPVSQWDTNYYAPVGTTTTNFVHNVFVFNQFRTNLTVLYSTRTTNGSFTVTNYTPYKFPMPLNSDAASTRPMGPPSMRWAVTTPAVRPPATTKLTTGVMHSCQQRRRRFRRNETTRSGPRSTDIRHPSARGRPRHPGAPPGPVPRPCGAAP